MRSVLAVCLALAVSFAATHVQASCARLDHSPLLRPDDSVGLVAPLTFQPRGARDLRWGAMRAEAPPRGTVYVFDCDERPLDTLPLGFIRSFRAGPRVGGRSTVEATFVSVTGSGVWSNEVALLQYRDGKIHQLWSHKATEAAALKQEVAERWRWRYLDNQRIRVSGIRVVGRITNIRAARARGRVRRLPTETYCYDAPSEMFLRCENPGSRSFGQTNP